jgi:hypothetical protein
MVIVLEATTLGQCANGVSKYHADVRGDKFAAFCLQSVSGVSAISSLVAFTTPIEEREGAILIFCPAHHIEHRNVTRIQHRAYASGQVPK